MTAHYTAAGGTGPTTDSKAEVGNDPQKFVHVQIHHEVDSEMSQKASWLLS